MMDHLFTLDKEVQRNEHHNLETEYNSVESNNNGNLDCPSWTVISVVVISVEMRGALTDKRNDYDWST